MSKEKRFEIDLQTYQGEIDIIEEHGKVTKAPLTDVKLMTIALEMSRCESTRELRQVDHMMDSIESATVQGVNILLLRSEDKALLTKKIQGFGWGTKKELRKAVLSLESKLEIAKEVEVEVSKA